MSDSESESGCEWEEVTDEPSHEDGTELKDIDNQVEESAYKFPTEGIQITLGKNDFLNRSRKKGFDPAGIIRRELNRQKRELQVYLHKVNVLCFLAQGVSFNRILRDQELFDLASTTLESKKSANLPKHIDLGYMEKFIRWFRVTYITDPDIVLSNDTKGESAVITVDTLKQSLCIQLQEYKVANNDYLAFIFVLILRSMGIQARLIWSLQPTSLKPKSEELLKAPVNSKCKAKDSEHCSIKSESHDGKYFGSSTLNSDSDTGKLSGKDKSSIMGTQTKSTNIKIKVENQKTFQPTKSLKSLKGSPIPTNAEIPQNPTTSKASQKSNTLSHFSSKEMLGVSKVEVSNSRNSNTNFNKRMEEKKDDKYICDRSVGTKKQATAKPKVPAKSNTEKSPSPARRVLRSRSKSKPSTENTVKSNKISKLNKTINSISEEESECSEGSNSVKDFQPTLKKGQNTNKASASTKKKFIKKKDVKKSDDPKTGRKNLEDSDSDFDFIPTQKEMRPAKTQDPSSISKVSNESDSVTTGKSKRVILPISLKSEKNNFNFWAEVFLEEEERWVCVNLVDSEFLCDSSFERKLANPICYILAFGNLGQVKDVTRRYASQWLTVTQKLRADNVWWNQALRPFRGQRATRDKEEDEFLDQQVLVQPFPKSIQEFKNHPLFMLRRHLLKFEAIYPPEPVAIGFIKNEPFFSRECVKILHSREPWLKKAKVVRIGETPYKVVKSRPKYVRMTGQVIKDQPLELFGEWQVEDYIPEAAKDGKVPRNEYGNVNLFLDKMLPRGTVHITVPGLQRVARKLDIDCARAVVGFDFNSGGCHPSFHGFIVCEEYKDILLDAWSQEQDESIKKEEEKRKARIYNNWRRLIKGVLIRERLEHRYSFNLGGTRKRTTSDLNNKSFQGQDTNSDKRRRQT